MGFQQLHQQPGPDNDELPRHLKRLQMVAQFGSMVSGDLFASSQRLGRFTRMGIVDRPDFYRDG
jgi:hypothetical protein